MPAIRARPRSSDPWSASTSQSGMPASSRATAIPAPMVPPPITAAWSSGRTGVPQPLRLGRLHSERQFHTPPRGRTTAFGRLARGIELIILDLRGERLAVLGKRDPFHEHAPARWTPATALDDLIECRRSLGHVELVLGLELPGPDLPPDPVCRWHRRSRV